MESMNGKIEDGLNLGLSEDTEVQCIKWWDTELVIHLLYRTEEPSFNAKSLIKLLERSPNSHAYHF